MFTLIIAWIGLVLCVLLLGWSIYGLVIKIIDCFKKRNFFKTFWMEGGTKGKILFVCVGFLIPLIVIGLLTWAIIALAHDVHLV